MPACCPCKSNGVCKSCVCVKSGRVCRDCAAGKAGRCQNHSKHVEHSDVHGIDLLPNYGPGTSKRYRKPVTTDNTVISNCEKRNFRRSSDLVEAKIYLFAVLVILDMPSTNHFFWFFLLTSRHNGGFGGVLWGVCFRTLSAVVSRFWQLFRRLGPLKIGLVILGNLRKCEEKFQFEIESLRKEKVKNLPSPDQVSRSVDKGQDPRIDVASPLYLARQRGHSFPWHADHWSPI